MSHKSDLLGFITIYYEISGYVRFLLFQIISQAIRSCQEFVRDFSLWLPPQTIALWRGKVLLIEARASQDLGVTVSYLSKYTVKELREIAKRMDLKIPGVALSKATKDLLVTGIEALIEYDHEIALDMNAEQTTYEISGVTLTGDSARVMIRHEENIRRYNPTLKRDKNGAVILTPKQRRRAAKKLHRFAKGIGFFPKKTANA